MAAMSRNLYFKDVDRLHVQAADEYLKGVVNAAGRESSSVPPPDVLAALRDGAHACTAAPNLNLQCGHAQEPTLPM